MLWNLNQSIYYNHIPVFSVECSALLIYYIRRSVIQPSIDDDRRYMVAKSNVDRLSIDPIKADIRDINCDHIGRHLQSITVCYRYIGDQNRQSMLTYSTKNWDWEIVHFTDADAECRQNTNGIKIQGVHKDCLSFHKFIKNKIDKIFYSGLFYCIQYLLRFFTPLNTLLHRYH